jgi:iron complex transport system substrate-binding protein
MLTAVLLSGVSLPAIPSFSFVSSLSAAEASPSESVDCFPHKARLRYAHCFTIDYRGTYKRVEVRHAWRSTRDTFVYILVPRGQAPPPDLPKEAIVVPVPVERMAVFSTSWTAFFPMLHAEKSIVGLAGCEWVMTPEVVSLIRTGAIQEIGDGGRGMSLKIHLERLTLVKPEAVMVYATGIPDFDQHPKLLEAGFKPIVNAAHMEATPLGRTEWIKLIAAFFNREAEAERLFDAIALRYEALAETTKSVSHRPTVFCNAAWRGTWYVPGGASYAARFLEDAGARYLWREDPSAGSTPLAIETVVDRARDADYWVDTNLCRSLAELKGLDDRYSLFASFRSGKVFNNDAKINAKGGNDFWETGIARPDLVLADLISIFHPELTPDHQRVWYRQLPAVSEATP